MLYTKEHQQFIWTDRIVHYETFDPFDPFDRYFPAFVQLFSLFLSFMLDLRRTAIICVLPLRVLILAPRPRTEARPG